MADDEEVEYVFQASGDACEICSALDGTVASDLPHDNCLCQIVAKKKKHTGSGIKGSSYSFGGGSSSHYGPGNSDYSIGTEIEVECCDGTSIGESIEFDGHDLPDVMEDAWQAVYLEKLDAAAGDLAQECPECADDDLVA